MERLVGVVGMLVLLGAAFLLSTDRRRIPWRLVITGLVLQVLLALLILGTGPGAAAFSWLGGGIKRLLDFADRGGEFVFGPLARALDLESAFGAGKTVIFFVKVIPTIIFVSVLVAVAYHLGLMQRVIKAVAWAVYKLMKASGAEATSNTASAFLGQVEAQILIKPYLPTMTRSELMASMTGSMACIAGGVMAVYIGMGIPPNYLLAGSVMSIPAALAVAKLMHPETEHSPTQGKVEVEVKREAVNLLDAISQGASDGMRVSLNVVAMLLGFIALIALVDALLGGVGYLLAQVPFLAPEVLGADLNRLSLTSMLGTLFSGVAWLLGVPWHDAAATGALMGTKLVVNEFVAYQDMAGLIQAGALNPRTVAIATFALCGFANFSSVAIQVGGIGQLAPQRRADLARLGFRALIGGTLTNYLNAALAGIIL